MRYLIVICILLVVYGCNNSSTRETGRGPNDTLQQTTGTDTLKPTPVSIQATRVTPASLPASITIKGTIKEAWHWTDNLGDNYFVMAVVPPYPVKDADGNEAQTGEVHAIHYAQRESDKDYIEIWSMSEEEKECPLDIVCDFIPNSATITDLDHNSIAEIKLQYAVACHGDVSPSYMSLLLYENGVRYSLKGDRWVQYGPEARYTVTEDNVDLEKAPAQKEEDFSYRYGRYETEKEFAAAPPEFLTFARKEWLKYAKE